MRSLPRVLGVAILFLLPAIVSIPALANAQNSAPVVSNVTASQKPDSGVVYVEYDVSDDGDSVTTFVYFSSDNGVHFDLRPLSLQGDVNKRIPTAGHKRIRWNAVADKPGQYFAQVVAKVYATDGVALGNEMVLVPAGDFTMGSSSGPDEQPQHVVYVDSFYVDKYEVTCAEYQRFIEAGGYDIRNYWSDAGWSWRTQYEWMHAPYGWGGTHLGESWPGFPVTTLSYYEAEAYATFAGKRIPTEAEWEKAARGTDAPPRTYPWGEGIDSTRANYANSHDPYEGYGYGTTPVGFYNGTVQGDPPFQTTNSPGPYGTYDQAGNVIEWVKDWYQWNYYTISPSRNPPGPAGGTEGVMRGGGWYWPSGILRCAARTQASRASQGGGLRCVRSVR